ncbi:hypothetical protein CU311_06000 [Prochlorococcus marinus str. MU1402]|uniref:hypothetical protein n=1 Tax=Prochlorococcus marinus TaxID=1219 RepID=UPI001AD9C610|nr:hypothetical protein [Prochlorococcus marinus]MBO8232223.1 hypothetical protein [Prochlorococcus marinus XMU1402]MBW3056960.1 hypothetical protein [Prochlorococcus marinus str. MU1402]
MKRFYLLPLSLIMLTGCKYGSYYEAKEACNEWSNKVPNYAIGNSSFKFRYCRKEEETSQVLGFEYINIKPIIYKYSDFYKIKDPSATKIKKRFKY